MPFSILVHKCGNTLCIHELKKVKSTFKGVEFYIHPIFKTGDDNKSIFPTVKFGDLNLGNYHQLKKQEFLKVLPQLLIKDVKECNTLRIDFPKGVSNKTIESIENQLIHKLLNRIRYNTNQYWINTSIFKTQKVYESYHLKMKSFNLFSGEFQSDIVKATNPINFPIQIFHLNSHIWMKSINELELKNSDMSKFKMLDGINSILIEDFESMILNFAIAIEIKKNILFKEIWRIQNPNSKLNEYDQSDLGIKDFNLPSHIHKHLKRSILDASFKDDYPYEFKYINYLWKFRGNIAHGESAIINHDVQNIKLADLNRDELIKAVVKTISYLEEKLKIIKTI